MTTLRYLDNVVTLEYTEAKCVGCGLCAIVCPQGVFDVVDGKAQVADRDACMECGACARNCPVDAIQVEAGVGCAAGVISGALKGKAGACCG